MPPSKPKARAFERTDRLAGTIQREIARLLTEEYKDPRVGMITVLEVHLTKDLSIAQVFVSVLAENQAAAAVQQLNKTAGFFRSHLAKVLKLRVTPQVQFVYDDTMLRGNRINDLLKGITDAKKP